MKTVLLGALLGHYRPSSSEDLLNVWAWPMKKPTQLCVRVEDNGVSHRIEELVESGVIEDVLDCFDFFQEMKKLKKDK